ncbi:serine/threonine protein kinase [Hydrogenophaga crassostreae]|uniref:non-specific serine/threonine protein kinase n=1 Tax=Hydrogenophaga crassostreae TaxID=1763535 RepID=A0A1D8P1F7_9BURK|nr:serine/threonine protein kinase [Hydrogenophaga crassostreae]
MPLPTPRKKRRIFSDALLAIGIALGVILVQAGTRLFTGLELQLYDTAISLTPRLPSDRIAVIAIDDTSIANIGRWPWPREVHARLIDQLSAAGAKTIAHTAFFFEPQTDRGLESLRALRDTLGDAPRPVALNDLGPNADRYLRDYINAAEQRLDSDAVLASSMRASGRVVIPSLFTLGDAPGRPDAPLPGFARRSTLPDGASLGMPATATQQPMAMFGDAAQAVAHLNPALDVDGAVRAEPLLVRFDGEAVPSMALTVAAITLNLNREDVKLMPGEGLMLGARRIETDPQGRVLPQYYPPRNGKPAFSTDAFYDVIAGKIPASKYKDKVVIIGATAAGVGTFFKTPVSAALSPAEMLAHTTSSLLQNHFIASPGWSRGAVPAVLVLLVAYLALVLPRLSAARGAWVSLSLFLGMVGLEVFLLAHEALWLPLVFPAALLLIGHLALVTRRFGATESRKLSSEAESAETNRQMGLSLQSQGQLDMAFDRLRRVPHSESLMENLRGLALDFERKRQFAKAETVYAHMLQMGGADGDLQRRLNRARDMSQAVMLGGNASHPGGTLLLTGDGIEKPMLGRYQIERELGKGAMGVVYQGRDPKIGRVVAIKTLALSAEFDGHELQDARERFFREAETAGRLQHPNIVTIFDAGEEHDLAFIAMEFLNGQDLVVHARPGQLLPMAAVLEIGIQVAQALDYAHRHQVIHRDIKPGNIMFDAVTAAVKVTDFGIARVTDANRTKTGTILGTPSFMSPEQLAGRRLDGRSDLYSLGVTLYQLLTGTLPFRGDSLSALMYDIANSPPLNPLLARPDMPQAMADILERTLSKAPEDRYATGEALATELHRVASALPEGGDMTGVQQSSAGDDPYEATLVRSPRTSEVNSTNNTGPLAI